jgi:hypothetical protein
MLPAKLGSIWPSSFRGEGFVNSSQSEKRIALGGHVCWPNSFFIWFQSAKKYGRQEQFLFLIGYC